MAGQNRRLDDKELLALFQDERADLSLLDPEEHQRLLKLTESASIPKAALPVTPATPTRSSVSRAADALPMVGGMVGGMTSRVPVVGALAAGIGGAAGEGYKDLVQGASQIPGALVDVARNLFTQPQATLGGFVEGATQGAKEAALQGAGQAALEGAGTALVRGAGAAGKAVYRGYLKPSLAANRMADAKQIVETAIKEGLPITASGVKKADKLIGELNAEVDRVLAMPNYARKTMFGDVDLHDIANQVRAFAKKKYGQVGSRPEDFQAAMRIADNIDAHPSLNLPPGSVPGPTPQSLPDAQAVKQRLQQSLKDAAWGAERSAGEEAEKHGAFRLREAIELRAPDVGKLNARESRLIDASKAIAHAVNREANNNALVGVKSIAAAGAGGIEYGRTGDPYTAAAKALALRLALTPAVATRLAITTARIGKLPGVAPASAARLAAVGLMSAQEE